MTLHVNLTTGSFESAFKAHPERRRPGDELLDYAGTLINKDPTPRRTLLKAIRRAGAVDFYVDDLPTAQLGRISLLKVLGSAKTMTVLDLQNRARRISFREVFVELLKRGFFYVLVMPWLRLYEAHQLRATMRWLSSLEAVPARAEPPRRVAYFRTDLLPVIRAGGSVAHISGVANALVADGIDVKLWSTALIPTVKPPLELIPIQADLSDVLPGREYFVHGRRFVDAVEPDVERYGPDLLYWRHSLGGLAGVVLSQKLRVPLILEYNGSEVRTNELWSKRDFNATPIPYRDLLRQAEELSFKLAARIVTVSSVLKDELVERGVPASKVQVEPNCVDLERFPRAKLDADREAVRAKLGFKPEHNVVGFIGTFGKWHGVQVLAKAVKPALEKEPSLRFLMIGDGGFMPDVRATLEADRVMDKVVLTGLVPQEQAPALLNACDFHVSPHVPNDDGSQFFGSPTKLFEYMACGRGIVASSLNQIGEVLRQNETAVLVPPGDLGALVDGMVELARDHAKRDRLGRAALEDVKAHFTWQANVRGLLDSLAKSARPESKPLPLPVVELAR